MIKRQDGPRGQVPFQHLKRIYADNELEREATIKKYLIVQTEGNRQVQRIE